MEYIIIYVLLSALATLAWIYVGQNRYISRQERAHKAYRDWADAKINAVMAELRALETKSIQGDEVLSRYLSECQ